MSTQGFAKCELELLVNGMRRHVTIRSADTLLRVLREQLGLTGAKAGCENGDCGACTVIVNKEPIKSCLMLAVEAHGCKVTTIEGLSDTPIQQAFIDKFAFQCGFCTPGFIMVCQALIEQRPHASEAVVQEWLRSNICRCTCYQEIREAVRSVIGHE
ncbi:(2Fe-2S)-binding protein [Paenibacillus sp. OV219]|uniref:(2Fe-2S)-binding protein n=1 Tax=Paenibacillus sp. OV219 TaxID=1884377 RepID=UPI0008D1529B|nr:(2Fe-2S)-binding protein [Paenibacillus sp. OV219]SEO30825.1 carbon-monoxide dehydrogenase small subunit [Paenibacillus sp. OV219]